MEKCRGTGWYGLGPKKAGTHLHHPGGEVGVFKLVLEVLQQVEGGCPQRDDELLADDACPETGKPVPEEPAEHQTLAPHRFFFVFVWISRMDKKCIMKPHSKHLKLHLLHLFLSDFHN